MPDETTAAAEPVVDTTPAVPVPDVTVPNADTILERIKASIHEANKPEAKVAPNSDASDAPDDKPRLNADKKLIRSLGALQAEKRELLEKVRALEPLQSDATLAREVKELWSKGREGITEALGKIAGKDGLDALAEIVALYYEAEQDAGDEGAAKPQPSVETKALLGAIEGLKKEIADLKSGREDNERVKAEAEAAETQAAAADFVTRFLDERKGQFEISTRPENLAESTELVQAAAFELFKLEGIKVEELTQEAADVLYEKAAAEVEAEYERTGMRYTKKEAPKAHVFDASKYARRLSVPTVTLRKEALSPNVKEREAQVRRRLVEKFGG